MQTWRIDVKTHMMMMMMMMMISLRMYYGSSFFKEFSCVGIRAQASEETRLKIVQYLLTIVFMQSENAFFVLVSKTSESLIYNAIS